MKALRGAVLGVCLVTFAGTATAQDDNAKKIMGAWEIAQKTGELPVGSGFEFLKDGKMVVVLREDGKDVKFDGTYKFEKEKLVVTLTVMGEKLEEALTIKKLTDDTLELEDKDKKTETFKKKK
jgi:uncharacterized protein (TIGR03066 family)